MGFNLYQWLNRFYPDIAEEWNKYSYHPYFNSESDWTGSNREMGNNYKPVVVCGYCETKNDHDSKNCISCGAPIDDYITVRRNDKPGWCL